MKEGLYQDCLGNIRLRVLLWILFLILAGYFAYVLVPPYVSYHLLKKEVHSEAKNAHHYTDAEITGRILEKGKAWGVPITHENIEVIRWSDEIEIIVEYSVELDFYGNYYRTVYYNIYAREPLSSGRRRL